MQTESLDGKNLMSIKKEINLLVQKLKEVTEGLEDNKPVFYKNGEKLIGLVAEEEFTKGLFRRGVRRVVRIWGVDIRNPEDKCFLVPISVALSGIQKDRVLLEAENSGEIKGLVDMMNEENLISIETASESGIPLIYYSD